MQKSTLEAASQLYSPLKSDEQEIRLITIEGADDSSADIHCQIETVNLSSSPLYDALSYVWGDAKIRVSITLNGLSVQVTTNLYQALKRLRARPGTSRIWIDALCIDQSSTDEKSSQIPLMGKIYSQAEKVLIWVGEEEEDSTAAMALIQKWGAGAAAAQKHSVDAFWPNSLELTLQNVENPFDEREITAFGLFLSRGYWRRVWIIQEIVLSQHRVLICGGEEVPYEQFFMTHYLLSELLELNRHDTVGLDAMRLIFNHIGEQSNPTNAALATIRWLVATRQDDASRSEEFSPDAFILAARTRASLATDLRDKVYGILGLVSSHKFTMEPSYTMEVTEVYTHFTLRLIESSASLRIICLAGVGVFETQSSLKLPSWVPDLSREPETSSLAASDAANDQNFRAAKNRQDYYCCYIGPQPQLLVQGVICDEITQVTEREPLGYAWLWKWWELCIRNCPSDHPSGIPLRQAFFRTLIHDASGFGYGGADFISPKEEEFFFSRASGFMTLMRRIALEAVAQTDVAQLLNLDKLLENEVVDFETLYWLCNSSVTHDPDLRTAFLDAFIGAPDAPNRLAWPLEEYAKTSSTHGFLDFAATIVKIRSFVITKRGYVGTGPHRIERGDLVCVLLGCPVPLIIRKQGSNFIVVGEAYIYGMMHGEMIDELESGRFELETLIFE
ncbi:HET-domain-containing protein [Stipitochalara longipes BDJ]|nr:HET-domain-containing protein [Stipitochalara longipes BDJ]